MNIFKHRDKQYPMYFVTAIWAWLINDGSRVRDDDEQKRHRIDRPRAFVFLLLHLACLAVFFVGVSTTAVVVALLSYFMRMFFITAFYHRYFSHRSYQVSRPLQFLMALAGCTAGQRGPLWWAGHHRIHHSTSDSAADPHSPAHGFWNSHTLWFLRRGNFAIPEQRVKDWMRYPELRFLERFDWLPFLALAGFCYLLGAFLHAQLPQLQTSGAQLLVWGFFVATIVLYHATYTINSLAHSFGRRRFDTKDDSRNNLWLALLTLGEGWHNNHHRYPFSARQGFYWWEVDFSYYGLKLLALMGFIRNIKTVPPSVLAQAGSSETK